MSSVIRNDHTLNNKGVLLISTTQGETFKYCPKCTGNHQLSDCAEFIKMSPEPRLTFVKLKGRCFLCLKGNHTVKECHSKWFCGREACRKRHHQLLHEALIVDSNSKPKQSIVTSTNCNWEVLLGIVPVSVEIIEGTEVTYPLLDPGSQITLVMERLAKKLKRGGKETKLSINTASGRSTINTREIGITLTSMDGTSAVEVPKAYVIPTLPFQEAPTISVETLKRWQHLSDIKLSEAENKEITILVGSDIPEAHWVIEQRIGQSKEPYTVRSLLGWTIRRPMNVGASEEFSVSCVGRSCNIESLIERLYNIEFENLTKHDSLSQDAIQATKLVQSFSRYGNGSYTIGLPWKADPRLLPNNQSLAMARLKYQKTKLVKDPVLFKKYSDVLSNYIIFGYANRIPPERLDQKFLPRWYLPHHAVINPKKPNKLRVVFDCAEEYQGWSLNKCLLSGPNVIHELVSVLLRFREGYAAMAADIKEMFLRVKVPETVRGALRFLWWTGGNINAKPDEYELSIHLFGATSSRFCAISALQKTVEDFGNPRLINIVKENFYETIV